MKSFLKYLLASILGVMIASLVVFFIFLGIIGNMVSRQERPLDVRSNTVLKLSLESAITDRASDIPVITMSLSNLSIGQPIGLNELLPTLAKAEADSNISGIYLELSGLQTGIATIEEIRNALLDFKSSGKFIVAYSDTYSQGAYYLSTVADKLYLNPAGYVTFVGLSAEVMFYRQLIEKLEIEPEIVRHGEFKSAVEPYMYDRMSDESREQISDYVNSIWGHMVSEISGARGIPVDDLNNYADRLVTWSNATAEQYDLVDDVLYYDQVMDTLACLSGRCGEDVRLVGYQDYLRVPDSRRNRRFVREKIAVIYASGTIVMGNHTEGFIGSESMSRTIREAREDSTVKAIVLRVNSGGGSALASEVIWRELDLARQVKPVIASMGDLAASGGYYILAPADTILASPVTITGSIGVFGLTVNAGDFLENKIGITVDVVTSNDYSDFGSIFRPLSDQERLVMQNYVDESYVTFVNRVADGRSMAYDRVDAIAEGRVWSGSRAQDHYLVDVLGGLNDAVDIAAEKAGLEEYRVVELPELEDPLTRLLHQFTVGVKEKLLAKELRENYRRLQEVEQVLGNDRIQARMPFSIEVR